METGNQRLTASTLPSIGLDGPVRELETLLSYARSLATLMEKIIVTLRAGQWTALISLKEEYLVLEKEQHELTPILLAYDSGKPGILSKNLQVNLNSIQTVFEKCSDVIFREFKIGTKQQVGAFLVMIEGLVNTAIINENLMKSLFSLRRNIDNSNAFMSVKECAVSIAIIQEAKTLQKAVDAVLSGDTILVIDGSDTVLICSARGWESRDVKEPDTEAVVRGPREGFIETLRGNTALIRRKIKNPNLKLEMMRIGKYTQTDICIAYINGIVDEGIVEEVKVRLGRIEIDSILESGYIESLIEDTPFSLFSTVGNSEKPDNVSAKLLEGRVAILVDGTPFVLTVPYLLVEAFQVSEDYYSRPFYVSFVRLLRWMSFIISVFAPAVFVAITTFQPEMMPPALLTSITAAREGVPFPAAVEAFLMQIVYEILREAGVRLPRPIGQAVSIVGALVIGDAAVSAGLISAPMVVVVALTAIASFLVPPLADVNLLLRLCMIILAGFSGLYGIMLGIAGILVHLCSLRSFGVPYLSPIAPITIADLKDVFFRVPLWKMLTRPRSLGGHNPVRQKSGQMPRPPDKSTPD